MEKIQNYFNIPPEGKKCEECNNFATKDYNGYEYYVCDYHYNKLNDEFDEEYK